MQYQDSIKDERFKRKFEKRQRKIQAEAGPVQNPQKNLYQNLTSISKRFELNVLDYYCHYFEDKKSDCTDKQRTKINEYNNLENLHKSQSHNINRFFAHMYVDYFYFQFVEFIETVNDLRQKYAQSHSIELENKDLLDPKNDWVSIFCGYFRFRNTQKWGFKDDGTQIQSDQKNISKTKLKLQQMIFSQKSQPIQKLEAFNLINEYCFIDFKPFDTFKLKQHWDPYCSDLFLNTIEKKYNHDVKMQKCICFYILLATGGLLLLEYHGYKFFDDKEKNQAYPSQNLCFAVNFQEALTKYTLVESMIITERVPEIDSENQQIKYLKEQQFLLFSNLRFFNSHQALKDAKISEVEAEGLAFLDSLNLENNLYYHVFKKEKVQLSGYQLVADQKCINIKGMAYFPQDQAKESIGYAIKSLPIDYFTFCKTRKIWTVDYGHLQTFEKFKNMTISDIQIQIETFKTSIQQKSSEYKSQRFQAEQNIMMKMQDQNIGNQMEVILKLLPVFNLNLNKTQISLITSTQNLLCLGRSGTGKTTALIMRMFAQEILYRRLLKHKQIQKIDKSQKVFLTAEDMLANSNVRYVFVTASPVLSSEVNRFYSNLKDTLINYLKAQEFNRNQRIKQRQLMIENQNQKESLEKVNDKQETSDSDSSKEDHPQIENNLIKALQADEIEKQELLQFIEMQERDLMEQNQVEKILQMPSAFTDLKAHHFPLFTTIQKLIYMLDACLPNSFFTRDKDKNIIGMNSNLGWHSECASFGNDNQGVMMINTHHRTNIDFNHQLGKFGEQLLELDQDQDQIQKLLGEQADQIEFNQQYQIIQERDQQLKEHINSHNNENGGMNKNKKIDADMRLSFEVTFEIFENQFYSRFAMQRAFKKLSASSVWTEIYSVIKGGMRAAESTFGYVQLADYLRLEGSEYLSGGEKRNIYYAFLAYEKWKKNVGAFDFMDVVQHVWKNRWQSTSYVNYYRRFYTSNLKYDYLLIDEVQDLPPKAIKLLLECASENVFFAGDTAQTIAKGVGSRFGDLRQTFSNSKLGQPKVIQLSTNYRSHQQILELANSVVSLIELFFPKSIDKLFKEGAERQGLIPIILQPVDNKILSKFIMGAEMSNKIEENNKQQQNESSPQFGCSQVVIVRDQNQKKQLPTIFQNFLCLTVYEAKGLEFNDVIIYNFFDESETNSSQWRLLNDLVYKTEKKPKLSQEILDMDLLDNKNFQEFQKKIKEYENLDQSKLKDINSNEDTIEFEEIQFLEIKEDGMFHKKAQASNIYKLFSFLCIELKLLYVIITRAKNRIIIYDDFTQKREFIQTYWQKLGLVHVVTKQMMMDPSQMPAQIKSFYEQGMTDDTTTPEQWKIQGIKLFQKKYYDQAIKCFNNSGNQNLVLRCEAHLLADKAEKLKNEANSLQWKVRNFSYLSKQAKKQYASESKELRKESQIEFKKAGNLFAQCNMYTFAGSCYYTANCLVQAAEMYQKLKRFAQAGECYFKLKKFELAAKMFEEGQMMPRAIECYEITQSWDQLLHSLSRCKNQFKDEERQSLVNKYVPIALNSLYKLISQDLKDNEKDNVQDKNKGQIQEMKIRMKYQKFVDQIVEEDEYGEEFEDVSSDDDQQAQSQDDQEEIQNSEISNENKSEEQNKEEAQTEKQEKSFEIEEESDQSHFLEDIYKLKEQKMKQDEIKKEKQEKQALKQEKEQKKSDEESFEVEDSENEEEDMNHMNKKLDDFEHLSQFDPDDEFLQSERSFSIIDSIMSDTKSFGIQSVMSSTSEFSIVQSQFTKSKQVSQSILSANSQISYNRQIEQIQTNQKDIYVEDVVTQKIIYYISLFSDEVKDQLSNLREKGILRDFKQKDTEKGTEIDEFLISLDQVSIEFINTIIDILDYYEMFKLSMMLCNRYGLTDRIGRYILQISSKYTNINTLRYNYEIIKPNTQVKFLFNQKQMTSSLLAHEALHNVFSLIDQQFLTLKPQGTLLTEKNSLGMQTYRTLLNLGFWKKLVYLTEVEMSLDLCFKFYNRQHFINIKENFLVWEDLTSEKQLKYKNLERWIMIRDYQITFQSFQNQSLIGVQNQQKNQIFKIQGLDYEMDDNMEIVKLIQKFNELIRQGHSDWTLTPNQYEKQDQIKKQSIEIENQVLKNVFIESSSQTPEKIKANNYLKYLITLNFVSQNKQLQSYLYKMNDFSQSSLHQLFLVTIQVLRYLTGMQSSKEMHNEELVEAIHSTFLISDIDQYVFDSQFKTENVNDSQGLFIDFQNKFMLMSVESPILADYIKYQQNIQNHQHNQNLLQQLKKINKNFYSKYMDPFKQQLAKIIQRFEKGASGRMFDSPNAWQDLIQDSTNPNFVTKLNQTNQSFIIDLDCQFIMVPKIVLKEVIFQKICHFLRQIQPKISAITTKKIYVEEQQQDQNCLYQCLINRETTKMFYKRFRQSQEIIKHINKIIQEKFDEVNELDQQKQDIFKNQLYIHHQPIFKNVQAKLFKIQNVLGVSDKSKVNEENGQVSRLTNYFHDNKNNLELQFHIGLISNSKQYGFDEEFAQNQSIRILKNAFNLSFLEKKAAKSSKDAPQTEDILQTALTTLLKSFSLIVASEQSLMSKSISGYESTGIVKYILFFNRLYRQFKIHFSKCTFQNKMKKIFKGFNQVFLIHDYISVGNYIQASYSYLDFINSYKHILTLEQNFKAIEMAFYCLLFSKKLSFQKKIYGSESLGYFIDLLQKDEIDNLVQENIPFKMNELQIYIDQGHEDFKNYEYYEEIEMKPLKMQKKESSYKEESGMEVYQISKETIYRNQNEHKLELQVFEKNDDEIILLNQIMSHLYTFIKEFLNPDEYVNSKRNIFTNIYNLLVEVLVNTDVQNITDKQLQRELVEKINKIFEEIMNGPFDSHFQNCYLLEQDYRLTVIQMKDIYKEFHQTDDHFKYTFFDFFKNKYNESRGALCISIDLSSFGINQSNIKTVKNNYDQLIFKRTKNMLLQNLLKQNLSKMIRKQNLKQKLQVEVNKKNISDDVKNLLSHFGLIDLIQSYNLKEVEQIWGAINNLTLRKHLLLEIISTKSAKTPLELDFIDHKISEINEYIFKFVDWLRNNYISLQKNILGQQEMSEDGSFAILDESCDQINEQSNEEMKKKLKEIDQLIVKFDASISIWHSQKMLEEDQNINSDIVISKEKRVMMKWSTLQKASRSISINILRANKDKLAAK